MTQNFHAAMRHHRELNGLSLRDLSEASGVSKEQIRRIERDQQPTLRSFVVIAEALNLTAAQIAILMRLSMEE